MRFKDIIGHEEIIRELIDAEKNKRIPHAMLFLAKEGSGGLPVVLAFVQYVMCEQKTENDSCGVCSSCVQMQKMEHPDVGYTFPSLATKSGGKNLSENLIAEFRDFCMSMPFGSYFDWMQYIDAEKKKGNISSDEARLIVNNMNLKAYQGGYKVHIIWCPEFLGREGNRLLKLIEEPPPKTLLILVGEQKEGILQTILSRVQLFRLKPLTATDIRVALEEKYNVDSQLAGQVALAAEGNFHTALQLKDNWSNDYLPIISQWLNAVYSNNGLAILEWVNAQSNLSIDALSNLLKYMQQLFAAGLRQSISPNFSSHLTKEDAEFVRKLTAIKLSVDSYQHINEGLTAIVYQIGRNTHVKLSLMSLSIQMQYWIKNKEMKLMA